MVGGRLGALRGFVATRRSGSLLCLALLCCAWSTACVTVYQPLSGLHRPVVVDPQARNLENVRLTVHCVPKDLLNRTGASLLCRRVATLLRNQGADVETVTSIGRFDDPSEAPNRTADDAGRAQSNSPHGRGGRTLPPTTDLTLELRARLTHQENNPFLWIPSILTFSLSPVITEYTFVQEVVVRDASGFLLVSDALKGRLVRYYGFGAWASNTLLDMAFREEDEKLTGDRVYKDFSADFYGQLSQLVLNAKMRWQVQQESISVAGTE